MTVESILMQQEGVCYLSVCIGDSLRRCEETVKISNCAFQCDYHHYYYYYLMLTKEVLEALSVSLKENQGSQMHCRVC